MNDGNVNGRATQPGPLQGRVFAGAEPLLVALLALLVRLPYLGHTPYVDELNHVMAAQSLLADGTMRLADGSIYGRAALLTYLVAGSFALFGESLVAARLPALAAGVLLVVVLWYWVRAAAGRLAAWLAALLLCFSPGAIYFSQQARFYSIQPLLFAIGAFAVYRIVYDRGASTGRKAALAVIAAGTLVLAMYFQPVTLIGIGTLLGWAAVAWLAEKRVRGDPIAWRRVAVAGGAAVLAMLVLLVLRPDAPTRVADLATRADEWAASNVGNVRFYYYHFSGQYTVLWALLPLLGVLALLRRPRATAFAACLFLVPIAVHSFLAWKHERYVAYTVPFLFAVIAIGAAVLLQWAHVFIRDQVVLQSRNRVAPRAAGALAAVVLVLSVAFLARSNEAVMFATQLITHSDAEWPHEVAYRGEANWRLAAPVLEEEARDAGILIGSTELKARYYLGRQDLLLSYDYLPRRNGEAEEFGVFPKMRRAVISTPESLERVMACYTSGLVVVEQRQWRRPWGVREPTAAFLEERAEQLELPEASRLLAFRWREPVGAEPRCDDVHRRVEIWQPDAALVAH